VATLAGESAAVAGRRFPTAAAPADSERCDAVAVAVSANECEGNQGRERHRGLDFPLWRPGRGGRSHDASSGRGQRRFTSKLGHERYDVEELDSDCYLGCKPVLQIREACRAAIQRCYLYFHTIHVTCKVD
jgi:hypothetical protein